MGGTTLVSRRPRALAVVRPAHIVVACTAVAALWRIPTLASQSYWYDEATTVGLLHKSFTGMLGALPTSESTPPLYYVCAWLWAKVFGTGEAGLRSFSAIAGTLTIPVAYEAARALAGRRTAAVTALLAAVSPALIWYSQEARSYALLTFLAALSLMFFARARKYGSARCYLGWAIASVLALSAHYFAIFVLIPEAWWLLWRGSNRRAAVRASVAVAVAGAALAPLAVYQGAHGSADWIAGTSFGARLEQVPYFFASGLLGTTRLHAVLLASAVLIAAAAWVLLRRANAATRGGGLLALGIGGAALAIPVLLKLGGADYVLYRNLLPAWLPIAIAVAAGLTSRRAGVAGMAALAAVGAGFVTIGLARPSSQQRDDWRGVAHALGPPARDRLIAVSPWWQSRTLTVYLPRLTGARAGRSVTEVDEVSYDGFVPGVHGIRMARPPAPFVFAGRSKVDRMTIFRYRAAHAVRLTPAAFNRPGSTATQVLFQPVR